ncbi:MAG TPA: hypothetical protein PKJ19_10880 [Flavobacteriales bacterium]|nr:hypothetical protein [Flavobacteriales bacterium]HNU56741.1 hypothetical protein [Flavobacteriales bacterium]
MNVSAVRAQAPPRMSYQAVVRDGSNALVVNNTVSMRMSVLQGSASGAVVYMETHSAPTNANGLASVELGGGVVQSGSIEGIDWSNGPYFLRSETDPNGGSEYSIAGTSQLLSVPFALYAANSEPGPPGPQGMPGTDGCAPTNTDSLIVLYNNTAAHGYYQRPDGSGHWIIQELASTNHSGIASKKAVILYNNSTAHAFYLDNSGIGQWSTHPLGNTNHTAVASDRSIVLYNNSTAFAFHVDGAGAGTWTDQALGNTGHSNKAHGDKIVVWNFSNAYAFAVDEAGNGAWTIEPLGGTTHNVITTR